MKAELVPLDCSKYYGTQVQLLDDDGIPLSSMDDLFEIWVSKGPPSQRQIKQWEEDYREDGEALTSDDIIDMVSDSHYESEFTYRMATMIVEKINSGELYVPEFASNDP